MADSTSEKVTILLRAVGDAPILKQKKCAVNSTQTIAGLTALLSKMLGLTSDQSLFLYISQTFAPSPDHTLQVLRNCYGTGEDNKELVIHYSVTQAWG